MAKFVLKDPYIEINNVDVSGNCEEVEITLSKNEEESTNFGTGGGEEQMHGLKTDSMSVTLHQDFAVSEIDDLLFPLYDQETEFPVSVRATAAPVSPSNPAYSATCKLFEYSPLSGAPGELVKLQIDLKPQRTGIARSTS